MQKDQNLEKSQSANRHQSIVHPPRLGTPPRHAPRTPCSLAHPDPQLAGVPCRPSSHHSVSERCASGMVQTPRRRALYQTGQNTGPIRKMAFSSPAVGWIVPTRRPRKPYTRRKLAQRNAKATPCSIHHACNNQPRSRQEESPDDRSMPPQSQTTHYASRLTHPPPARQLQYPPPVRQLPTQQHPVFFPYPLVRQRRNRPFDRFILLIEHRRPQYISPRCRSDFQPDRWGNDGRHRNRQIPATASTAARMCTALAARGFSRS